MHINDEFNARISKASAADYAEVFGIEVESEDAKLKVKRSVCSQHYYTHSKQFTNGMPKDWTTSIKAVLENF